MTGLVKMFDVEGGFGFIIPLIGRPAEVEEVFFHVSAIIGRDPAERGGGIPSGTEVDFVLVRSDRPSGFQAANVRIKKLSSDVLLKARRVYTGDSTSDFGPAAQATQEQRPPQGPAAPAKAAQATLRESAIPSRDSQPKLRQVGR